MKKYPIYSINALWVQDGKHNPDYPELNEGLPEGRINNWTGFNVMFKEEKSDSDLNIFLKEWWDNYTLKKIGDNNIELKKLEIKLNCFDTWNLTWFSHETFDEGQTDEEVLNSFEEYVSRIESQNFIKDYKDKIPLMGAEDRWRWSGTKDGTDNTKTLPPCRCEHCKKQGKIRINH